MAKKCKVCGKPVSEDLDYCSKECMEQNKAKNPMTLDPILERDLLDPSTMRGLSWRMVKLEAIHKARVQGLSDDEILLVLMRGGLTEAASRRLMRDSKRVYGE